jgi:adenylosuccinate lyase
MNNILSNLGVDEQRMLKNIEATQGRTMSEAVMTALIKKGMNRQEAHELLRKLTIKSETERQHFKETLLEDKRVSGKLTKKEIDAALNPRNYLGTATRQVVQMVGKTKKERRIRGLAE